MFNPFLYYPSSGTEGSREIHTALDPLNTDHLLPNCWYLPTRKYDGVTFQKTKSEPKIEATYLSKMFVSTNKMTLCQNSEDHNMKDCIRVRL
jgi:hypothetical protein